MKTILGILFSFTVLLFGTLIGLVFNEVSATTEDVFVSIALFLTVILVALIFYPSNKSDRRH